jgi:hypothetical protein
MKKLLLFAAVIAAFSASSVFAGSCGGCGGGKDKDKEKEGSKDGDKQQLTHCVNL